MASIAHAGRPAPGASIFNFGLAAFAAGALGFLAFAMPDPVFSDLVTRSGLPSVLPAAEPPLGMKARGAAVAAVALLVFVLVLILLRGIDRVSARPARSAKAKPAEAEAPRLRRSDSHPDAPARRPLLAGRDLGDFVADDEYDYPPDDEDRFADLPAQPLPGFLAEGRDAPAAAEPEIAEPVAAEPSFEEPEQPEPEPDANRFDEPAEEEPLVLDTEVDERSVEALVAQLPETRDSAGDNIAGLMQRLETGLVRREEQAAEAVSGQPEEAEAAPEAAPEQDFEPAAEPPSWLAPQAEAGQPAPEPIDEAGAEVHAEAESEPAAEAPSWLAQQPEAAEAIEATEPEARQAPPPIPSPPVDEFGELSWPPPRSEQPAYAPLGANGRSPSAPAKVQALPPRPPEPAAEIEPRFEPQVEPPSIETQIGHRLRHAISDLNKSARG